MQRVGFWILLAALFLGGQAWWRIAAPPETGKVTAFDGGGGVPPTKSP
jgi:hypothetical protein